VGDGKHGEVEFFYDVPQRSSEWLELRRGVPTASKFAAVMAESDAKDGRRKLLHVLAGELLSGEVSEGFRNEAMDRGVEMEPEAREWYARTRFADLTSVGFVRRRLPSGRWVGCSPDSQVGAGKKLRRKGLEIKTMRPELMVPLLERGDAAGFPPEFRAQCQGTLFVTGWESIELVVFYRGMPANPTFVATRDEKYIKELSDALEVFDHELHKLVGKIRKMGRSGHA
jgi:hypothetical protein